jgi:1,4-dihydroxy-2-naphthoyl-CoA synthase
MTSSEIETTVDGPVLTVVFNRPEQRNAMTWAMYQGLEEACARADSDDAVRVMATGPSSPERISASSPNSPPGSTAWTTSAG